MPRKKQIVQKKKRQRIYREDELSGAATRLKPKGAFRVFSNYQLFALVGVVAIGGGVIVSAFYTGGSTQRNPDGSVRGEGVSRQTVEADGTPSSGAAPTVKQYPAPPPLAVDPAKSYTATIKTDKGDIKIELLPGVAPETVNNFIFLANDGYYDGVIFHRVIADRLAQTGDPTGTGSGGPGYDLPVEKTEDQAFEAGVVAMAKPQAAGAPNNGSQFFITLSEEPTYEGKFTVFGRVVEGMDVLQRLTARDPDREENPPSGDRIESIEITET